MTDLTSDISLRHYPGRIVAQVAIEMSINGPHGSIVCTFGSDLMKSMYYRAYAVKNFETIPLDENEIRIALMHGGDSEAFIEMEKRYHALWS